MSAPRPSTSRMAPVQGAFLLVPGDGLVLVSDAGQVSHLDAAALGRLNVEATAWLGQPLEVLWPELATWIEDEGPRVAREGPLDRCLIQAERPQWVRLFRTDDGYGAGLLAEGEPGGPTADQVSSLDLYQRLLGAVRDVVLVTTSEPLEKPGPIIVYVNSGLLRQSGYQLSEVLGRSPRIFQGPDTDPSARALFRRSLSQWQPVRADLLNYTKDGQAFWVDVDVTPLHDGSGKISHWVSVQRDVSDRYQRQLELETQLTTCSLTGLPNRRGLERQLATSLERLPRMGGWLAVLFCDLDRFKSINDSQGHAAGDALLVEIARRLRLAVRPMDTVARFGGDEFVVVAEGVEDAASAERLANRVRQRAAVPWIRGTRTILMGLSVGLALTNNPRMTPESLIDEADQAMYRAKMQRVLPHSEF